MVERTGVAPKGRADASVVDNVFNWAAVRDESGVRHFDISGWFVLADYVQLKESDVSFAFVKSISFSMLRAFERLVQLSHPWGVTLDSVLIQRHGADWHLMLYPELEIEASEVRSLVFHR